MSTKGLMARMGHDDMRAVLVYQRVTSDADEKIADKLSELVEWHRQDELHPATTSRPCCWDVASRPN